jgi:hypothetical protein
MKHRRAAYTSALAAVLVCSSAHAGTPPAQRLPSALLVYPLIVVENTNATRDTRVEIVNLSNRAVTVDCFYLSGVSCNETGFQVTLTAHQPLSWLASQGSRGQPTQSAVPPFFGTGELKCVVQSARPELDAHNAIQGRAIVFGSDGQTIGYGAVGFRRLVEGEFDGTVELDGQTYEQCPEEMHFAFLASGDTAATRSEIVLTPCFEDLNNQIPGTATVQLRIINEFEQSLSAVTSVTCHSRRTLLQINPAFSEQTLGSDVGHLIVRGVDVPVVGMLIDRFMPSAASTSANEPALRGGRSGTVLFP